MFPALMVLTCWGEKLCASPTDIVPQGSTLLDSFAALAGTEAFGPAETPEGYFGDTLYTRGQLARLLAHLVENDPIHLATIQKDATEAALHKAVETLQPELKADGVDLNDAEYELSSHTVNQRVSSNGATGTNRQRRPARHRDDWYVSGDGSVQLEIQSAE